MQPEKPGRGSSSRWAVQPSTSRPGLRWYAARTRARAEKAVERVLQERGIECFLPLVERERRWADRRKRVSFPLFPGYLFVRVRPEMTGNLLAIPGLVDVVRADGVPTPVRADELDSVRRLMAGVGETGALPTPTDYLVVGEPVQVVDGPFARLHGILVEERTRARVAVRLSAIRQAVSIELDRRMIRPERGRGLSRHP